MTDEEKRAEQERLENERKERERQEGEELSKKSQAELVEYAKSLRTQNKSLRTERDNLRTERDSVAKERNDFKTKVEDREKEDLKAQNKFKELADKEKERADKAEQQRQQDLTSANERFIRAEVRAMAIKAGIHDPKDVDTMDIKDLRLGEDGAVGGIEEFVSARKAEKPHWFKADAAGNSPAPPPPGRQSSGEPKNGTDWSKATDADFDTKLNELMGRV